MPMARRPKRAEIFAANALQSCGCRDASATSQPRSASVAAMASARAPRPPMMTATCPSRRNSSCTNPGRYASALDTIFLSLPSPIWLALFEKRCHAFLRIRGVMHHIAGHRLEHDQRIRVGVQSAIRRHLGHAHAERREFEERLAEFLYQRIETVRWCAGIDQSPVGALFSCQ